MGKSHRKSFEKDLRILKSSWTRRISIVCSAFSTRTRTIRFLYLKWKLLLRITSNRVASLTVKMTSSKTKKIRMMQRENIPLTTMHFARKKIICSWLKSRKLTTTSMLSMGSWNCSCRHFEALKINWGTYFYASACQVLSKIRFFTRRRFTIRLSKSHRSLGSKTQHQ